MKLPRDIHAEDLIRMLEKLGYRVTRQTGSHVRMTIVLKKGEFHITVPRHKALRAGTFQRILNDVSQHLKKSKEEILTYLP